MADRFPGEIHISGPLRLADYDRKDIDAFLDACSEQPTEWGESGQREPLTMATIGQVVDEDTGWITLRNDQACGGAFEELEELCRSLYLPYDRHSDARYEFDGELVRWRPGMKQPVVENATQSGNALIHREHVEACLENFRDGRMQDGIQALQDLVPEVAPLPRFVVATGP